MKLQWSDILTIIIDLYLLGLGIYQVATGKGNDKNLNAKYTEESLRRYNKVTGVILIIAALIIIGGNLLNWFFNADGQYLPKFAVQCITVGIAVVALILPYFIMKKSFVPKERANAVSEEPASQAAVNTDDVDE